jgi:hypothetical protein
MDVVGMGESKTPKPFISACNKFKYLDLLALADKPAEPPAATVKVEKEEEVMTNFDTIKKAIITIVEENSDEDEWLFIGDIGNKLQKRYPDFDVRNFGYNKFTPFIKSLDLFDIKSERINGSNNKLIYIKEKAK